MSCASDDYTALVQAIRQRGFAAAPTISCAVADWIGQSTQARCGAEVRLHWDWGRGCECPECLRQPPQYHLYADVSLRAEHGWFCERVAIPAAVELSATPAVVIAATICHALDLAVTEATRRSRLSNQSRPDAPSWSYSPEDEDVVE